MAKLSQLRTDLTKELEGVWIHYELGIEFLIARTRHPEFKSAITKMERKHRRGFKQNKTIIETMTDSESKKTMSPLIAKHIIRDWKNIQDEKGKTIPYSEKEALKILLDPELEDVYIFILTSANESENFRKIQLEEDAGN